MGRPALFSVRNVPSEFLVSCWYNTYHGLLHRLSQEKKTDPFLFFALALSALSLLLFFSRLPLWNKSIPPPPLHLFPFPLTTFVLNPSRHLVLLSPRHTPTTANTTTPSCRDKPRQHRKPLTRPPRHSPPCRSSLPATATEPDNPPPPNHQTTNHNHPPPHSV